jgi:hypothetical protein
VSKRQYIEREFRVPYYWSGEAFRLLWKAPFYDKDAGQIFYRQHSEATTLYITGLVFASAVLIHTYSVDWETQGRLKLLLCVLAGMAVFAGISWDTLISRQEGAYLRTLPRGEVEKVLSPLRAGKVRN